MGDRHSAAIVEERRQLQGDARSLAPIRNGWQVRAGGAAGQEASR